MSSSVYLSENQRTVSAILKSANQCLSAPSAKSADAFPPPIKLSVLPQSAILPIFAFYNIVVLAKEQMKVSGFTFIRNAVLYGYPIVEAITSILPLCDEVVVAVGKSDDETLELIRGIDAAKVRIIETVWDDTVREGGRVLALETDKAFRAIAEDADWAFYIQGDEVLHEKYVDVVRENMAKWKDTDYVDGLLFAYKHFYGSYDYVGGSPRWYKNEIRVVKNDKSIYSYRDAQGFRKGNNEKLRVKPIDASIYHYGWVKDPRAMQRKQETFTKLWHSDEWVDKNVRKVDEFDYSGIDVLVPFTETHPAAMLKRIAEKNWKFDYDITRNTMSLKNKIKLFADTYLGINMGYANYRKV